jgi:hypothetical protein
MAKRDTSVIGRLRAAAGELLDDFQSRRDLSGSFSEGELALARRITTVVLPLGPYRNLTTMTAALYALHPNAVVLNHAAERVFGSAIDPFVRIDADSWLRFKAGALRLLKRGRSGAFGGNVVLSHAFRETELPAVYRARYGKQMLKPEASTLFWKDSMRLQNRFERDEAIFAELLARQPEARFIFPVRNPMDCARSNLQRGHWRHLVAKDAAEFGPVLRRVLESLRWFRRFERADPGRFLSFTELEIGAGFPERIAAFSNLPAPTRWAHEDAPKAIEVVPRSEHAADRRALYAALIAELFADDEEMRGRLGRFLPSSADAGEGEGTTRAG